MTLHTDTRHLREDVTHWPVTGSNGFGGFNFGAPVLLKGRWEEKAELFMDPNGEEVASTAIVYLSADTDVGDYICHGDYVTTPVADPTSLTTEVTHRIKQGHRTTDLRAVRAIRKVYL